MAGPWKIEYIVPLMLVAGLVFELVEIVNSGSTFPVWDASRLLGLYPDIFVLQIPE